MIESPAYDVADQASSPLESGRVRRAFDPSSAYVGMLDLAAALPFESGVRAVVRSVVDTLSRVLAGRAIGASVVLPGTSQTIVEIALPEGVPAPGCDPSRLFPELSDELVLSLDRLPGSTLHVAAVEGRLSDADELRLVRQAAALLASGARQAAKVNKEPAMDEVSLLRAQLIQAEKLASLGQIVAGVVHELANPVTSIVACTDFLLRRANVTNPAPEDAEQVKRISVAASRILKFVRDLIDYARPARESPAPVSVDQVLSQAHAFSEHELEQHGVTFSAELGDDAGVVLGQASSLTQLFVNLFTNAAHAMGNGGGRLQVRATRERSVVVIEVTDTGTGIPPDTLGNIFEPFFTTKEAGLGTGLGLAIVREIVKAHSGTVDVQSTPGSGTTFFVRLPLHTNE